MVATLQLAVDTVLQQLAQELLQELLQELEHHLAQQLPQELVQQLALELCQVLQGPPVTNSSPASVAKLFCRALQVLLVAPQ